MIICCGESLVDMIATDIGDGTVAFVPHTGGAIFNTAIALGRLGRDVELVSGVSDDIFGQKITADLRASGVNVSRLIQNKRPTTLAFIELVNGQASYSFFDENSAGRMLQIGDISLNNMTPEASYFGGISLASEPCGTFYEALAKQLALKSVLMVDPNIRPSFIDNEVRYRQRLDELFQVADIIKISDEDLVWIKPDGIEVEEKISDILAKGPSIVILTKGKHGATAYCGKDIHIHIPVQSVKVVDTIGAGDSFNAGFLAKLSELELLDKNRLKQINERAIRQALTNASLVAGITVSRSGANPPWKYELHS